jgi:hypothetical protein
VDTLLAEKKITAHQLPPGGRDGWIEVVKEVVRAHPAARGFSRSPSSPIRLVPDLHLHRAPRRGRAQGAHRIGHSAYGAPGTVGDRDQARRS